MEEVNNHKSTSMTQHIKGETLFSLKSYKKIKINKNLKKNNEKETL